MTTKHVHFAEKDAERLITPAPSGQIDVPRRERGVGLKSVMIMLGINFLANIVFSIVIPSIWPFLKDLGVDPADKSYVGWAVACNSAGTFISAPLLGAWADKWNTRGVMAVTLVVMIGANVCYSMANGVPMMMVGRFFVGVAAGNYAVVQSYFSYATKPSQRLSVMSWNAGTTVVGFIVGPAIAAACTFSVEWQGIKFSPETTPGFLSAFTALLALGALFFLEDVDRPSAAELAEEQAIMAEQAEVKDVEQAPLLGGSGVAKKSVAERKSGSVANYGQWIFGGSGYYTQTVPAPAEASNAKTWAGGFPVMSSYGSLYSSDRRPRDGDELIDDIFSDARVPWSSVVVCLILNFMITLTFTVMETIVPPYTNVHLGWDVTQNGIYFMVVGLTCIVSLVTLQFLSKVANERVLLTLFCFAMSGGFALNVNYNDKYPAKWRFFVSSGVSSFAYASGTAVLLSIYSKVLEGLDQGQFMGWFSAACSTARIMGPLVASYMLQEDPKARWIFGGVSICLFLSGVLSALCYSKLETQTDREEAAEAKKAIN